jgi:hypothetical protein
LGESSPEVDQVAHDVLKSLTDVFSLAIGVARPRARRAADVRLPAQATT